MFKYVQLSLYLLMSAKEREGQQDQEITEIRKTIIIDATPEVVFKAITDPNELTHWFPDQAILEPKVGGKMKFSFLQNRFLISTNGLFP
jgi:Activator of Hsp90 ATPase homolog 1-like protein